MSKPTLLFIPDISGFTKFVNQTEIQHSRHVISELLEILIDSNHLGLTLSEIEGDALLFYNQKEIPDTTRIVSQARSMFLNFHRHLQRYQNHRICQCGACRTAGNLSLKIIVHLGSVDFIKVKAHQKPYGPDVILAHRLLKNEVDNQEYLLLSQPLAPVKDGDWKFDEFPWLHFQKGLTYYENIGDVPYYYGLLSPLHNEVGAVDTVTNPGISPTSISSETYIDLPRDNVFEIIIDLEQRNRWNRRAKEIKFDHPLNEIGAKHVCVFDNSSLEFETVTNDFGKDNLVYGEKVLTLPPFVEDITVYFIVSSSGSGSVVKLSAHYKMKGLFGWVMAPFFKRRVGKNNRQALHDLKEWCETNS